MKELTDIIGVSFRDQSLLERALVHSSYCNENLDLAPVSNERLEFLGDAVLSFIIAEKLYRDFPTLPEGQMTKLRSALVRRDTLARVAKAIGLGEQLYLGRGEEVSGGRNKPANLESALEALIAAVFLDRGLNVTRKFVLRLLDEELISVVRRGTEVNYKSQLQELLQSRQQLVPVYRVVDMVGPAHERLFTVEVVVGDSVLGRGLGKSKKAAETEAARVALKQFSVEFTP